MRLVITGVLALIIYFMIAALKEREGREEAEQTYVSQIQLNRNYFSSENLIPQELKPWFQFSAFSGESIRIPFLPAH